MNWTLLPGTLMRGHQVASRPSKDYPYSSLEKQMTKPELTFPLVEWTDLHPPETFSFSRCKVRFQGKEYTGWVYYPHPETKKTHFQNPSLIEVITYEIEGIQYGDVIDIEVNPQEITIKGYTPAP